MSLVLDATGKLMLYNGKLFDDVNGTDCCCVPVSSGCTGCYKWVTDVAGQLVATMTISGNCGSETKSGLAVTGETNCNVNPGVVFGESMFFENPSVTLQWNEVSGVFVPTFLGAFLSADCGTLGITVTDYFCDECSFMIGFDVAVDDVSGCYCTGPVHVVVEIDMTLGPDCP